MSARPFFSGRIPQDLYDALEEHRQRTNESKTDILIKALSSYVNHPVNPPVSLQVSAVEASRIDALEEKLEALEQELYSLRGLFTAGLDSSASEQVAAPLDQPEMARKVEEEITNQIPLILTERVIKDDNSYDNNNDKTADNDIDNRSDNEKLDSESSDISNDNVTDNKEENLIHRVLVGTMKTAEVSEFLGLKGEDAKKIKIKLNNTKSTKTKTAKIDSYIVVFSKQTEAPGGKKQELFWDVYKEEEPTSSVISTDNGFDN